MVNSAAPSELKADEQLPERRRRLIDSAGSRNLRAVPGHYGGAGSSRNGTALEYTASQSIMRGNAGNAVPELQATSSRDLRRLLPRWQKIPKRHQRHCTQDDSLAAAVRGLIYEIIQRSRSRKAIVFRANIPKRTRALWMLRTDMRRKAKVIFAHAVYESSSRQIRNR